MKKIILAVVLFLPFLVSCSQNRKAPAVSPQTTVGKSEKTETAKVQYLTTSDFRKKIMDYYVRVWAVCHLFFRLDFQPEYDQGKIVLG